jgi:chromate transporter
MNASALLALIGVFGPLSLLSLGGGNTVLPEIHRQAVSIHGWLTDQQFAGTFAISQGAPGPSTAFIASLIGLKAAGWPGALVAACAMLLPAAAAMYGASLAWERFRAAPWRVAVEQGLAPISLGLLFAAGLIIVRAADHGWPALGVTVISTLLLTVTRVNPLLVMASAGFLGWLGVVR